MMKRRRKSRPEAPEQPDGSEDLDSSLRKLEELHRVNEQLLHQVEGEERREREMASLRTQLEQARLRAAELEQRLSDASQLRAKLEAAVSRAEVLKGSLEAEQEDNRRLRAQVTELRLENLRQTLREQRDAGLTTSLPDLHAEPPPADSWTAAASSFSLGEHPEISELISKHREVTRLNQELQRRCEEKLRGDKHPRPVSAGHVTSYWQTRLRQQEQALRAEMRQREGSLRAQLRELEERLRAKGEEEVGGALKVKLAGLEQKLQLSEEGRERMRGQLAAALSDCRMKDEEIKK